MYSMLQALFFLLGFRLAMLYLMFGMMFSVQGLLVQPLMSIVMMFLLISGRGEYKILIVLFVSFAI